MCGANAHLTLSLARPWEQAQLAPPAFCPAAPGALLCNCGGSAAPRAAASPARPPSRRAAEGDAVLAAPVGRRRSPGLGAVAAAAGLPGGLRRRNGHFCQFFCGAVGEARSLGECRGECGTEVAASSERPARPESAPRSRDRRRLPVLCPAWATGRNGVWSLGRGAAATAASTAMAVETRPELVGKRFLCVAVGDEARPERGESGRCRRSWRAGVIRAVSHRDSRHPDLAVRERAPVSGSRTVRTTSAPCSA